MSDKIYRNGKFDREKTSIILLKNSGIFLFSLLLALALVRVLHTNFGYSNTLVDILVSVATMICGLLVYAYRTFTRIRPLAYKQGDLLIINTGLMMQKTVDLSTAKKITCLYVSEHNQLMKIRTPGKAPVQFEIKQTDCTTEDLGNFITSTHDIEVSYS